MNIEEIDYVAWANQRIKDKVVCTKEPVMICHADFTLQCCVDCLIANPRTKEES
jgi:hypothetical protein